ncbi:MAG: NAD(P)H-dependent oxidoreductase subunit E [Phycisphaerae bacterium]
MTSAELAQVDAIVERIGRGRENVIPLLQALQEEFHYLPPEALEHLCEVTEISPAQITGVSSFYTQFRHKPAGEHMVKVCIGTACFVKNADAVFDAFCEYLDVPEGEDTDPEGKFTVEKVACLGCCTLAPAVQIDDVTFGHVGTDEVGRVLDEFIEYIESKGDASEDLVPEGAKGEIRISLDTCCVANGSEGVRDALLDAIRETEVRAVVKQVGCAGFSAMEPLVEVVEPGKAPALYANVRPGDAKAIVMSHFSPDKVGGKVRCACDKALDQLLDERGWRSASRYAVNVHTGPVADYTGRQVRIATEYCGQAIPHDLDEYLKYDGFVAFEQCLRHYVPAEVIQMVEKAGLRGRGGAGFPTAVKWATVAGQDSKKKYVVVNGDEGDPGAFMDRMLLESQPYRIIEGAAIAAYAVGADEVVFYIRAEYPIAVDRMNDAIEKCKDRGYLGEDLFGTGFNLNVRVMEGAGAFVCGEETALIASIEGNRGMPRLRPPYPAEVGLWGKPTLVNNAETLSMVSWIFRNSPEKFAAVGTKRSKGTKVFALAGKVERGGLIEVPMGTTINEVTFEVGGGIPDGKKFKAVQIGGPSGGCVPATLGDTPIDFEALKDVGAMMGSGGLVVLDEDDCMVEIARYFLEFTQDQSCGKCTFCRIGTRRMLDILERLCRGEGKKGDIEELQHLGRMVQNNSLCGLGKSAPNPVLSTLRYYRSEYEAHIAGRCPTGKCKDMIHFVVTDECIGCTKCAQVCPADAIEPRVLEVHEIDDEACVRCGGCKTICPVNAIEIRSGLPTKAEKSKPAKSK